MHRCLAFLLLWGCVLWPIQAQEVRAIWITRYDYKTQDEVRAIIANCAGLGVNRLIFQVRGNADAFYPSALEPWSEELGGKDPGFDPLALALEEAHKRGMALEAWINVLPLWKGVKPPAHPAHPYRQHPQWVVVGSDGQPQALNEHYVCANPVREDVRRHLAAVARDIATRYAVDAIHLDYIRYVTDLEAGRDFSFDAESLKQFDGNPLERSQEWRQFKKAQITLVVQAIREAVSQARPACQLTAAVFPNAETRDRVFQEAERWIREGLLDAVYPMIYTADETIWQERLEENLSRLSTARGESATPAGPLSRFPVYAGIGVFKHLDPEQTRQQIEAVRAAGAPGFCLFAYVSFFFSAVDQERTEAEESLRKRRAAVVRQMLRTGE